MAELPVVCHATHTAETKYSGEESSYFCSSASLPANLANKS